MNIPKFTAEVSLYQSRQHYVTGSANFLVTSRGIYPAYQDQNCLNGCLQDCGSVCVGSGKGSCIRMCKQENDECRVTCEIPGDPPVPPSGGGGGGGCSPLLPRGSGLPIYGNYCGPGHTDRTGLTPHVDAVDAVCREHDMCYDRTNYLNCGCDRTLILSMPAAIVNSPCDTGKAAGLAVMSFFAHAPCMCCPPWGCHIAGIGGVGLC